MKYTIRLTMALLTITGWIVLLWLAVMPAAHAYDIYQPQYSSGPAYHEFKTGSPRPWTSGSNSPKFDAIWSASKWAQKIVRPMDVGNGHYYCSMGGVCSLTESHGAVLADMYSVQSGLMGYSIINPDTNKSVRTLPFYRESHDLEDCKNPHGKDTYTFRFSYAVRNPDDLLKDEGVLNVDTGTGVNTNPEGLPLAQPWGYLEPGLFPDGTYDYQRRMYCKLDSISQAVMNCNYKFHFEDHEYTSSVIDYKITTAGGRTIKTGCLRTPMVP